VRFGGNPQHSNGLSRSFDTHTKQKRHLKGPKKGESEVLQQHLGKKMGERREKIGKTRTAESSPKTAIRHKCTKIKKKEGERESFIPGGRGREIFC